jgi:hypothetical protein
VGLITLGNMKEPFSLDELISSGNRTYVHALVNGRANLRW